MNEAVFIEQSEGKPAPMPLLAIQAFANTIDVEEGTDKLDSVESFRRFLMETDQIVPGFQVKAHHLPLARELRDSVRDALAANGDGGADPRITSRMIGAARTLAIDLQPNKDGRLMLDLSPVDSFATLGSQLLAIAFQAQIEGTWDRLKLCENPDCRWAFYDSSRNRSGSWCRMGLCGNRLKNRAYRERHRNEIAGSTTAAAVRPGPVPKGSAGG